MADATAFLSAVERKAKMFAPAAKATFEANQGICSWLLNPLARWTSDAYGDHAFDDAALGYARYCLGVAKAQQVYEKAGKYTPEALPELMSEVYESEGYMVPYMWAAILIYPFWPSMISHIALYRDEFLKKLVPKAQVLELASGHGVLGMLAAEERPDLSVEGVDISPPAVAVANRILGASGHAGRVRFEVKNALEIKAEVGGQYQGIIAAMLAEHVGDPNGLFRVISHHLAADGLVFFSTAIESAQRDHIYEFNHESEPLKMAEEAGLRVVRLASDASSTPPKDARFLPRATAMILRRR
jgi:2-polyprenyl-3-methyl-5-hydroxy-6-metoxy-1,4-benzoquinol methylase